MRTDECFLYQKDDSDGWLVTLRGDFAEMLHVDTNLARSKYERYEAPVELIRAAVKDLTSKGYHLAYSLDLAWKPLIEV